MGGVRLRFYFMFRRRSKGGVEVDLLLNSLDYFKLSVYGTSSV